MSHGIRITVDGRLVTVDGRDVASDLHHVGPVDPEDADWVVAAEAYVERHPRGEGRTADAQRLALLQRLAAGPASTTTLLRAMRRAGWVAASDLENRVRDLRGGGQRGAGRTVAVDIVREGDIYRLAEPLPLLDEPSRRALGFAKALVARQGSPLAAQAVQALDALLPGLATATGQRGSATMKATSRHLHLLEQARQERRPVRITYWSITSEADHTYLLVPVEYVPVGPALKAVCVVVRSDGTKKDERQFALDRLVSVQATDLDPLTPEALALDRSDLHLEVTGTLYRILSDRNQFGVRDAKARIVDDDVYEVRGAFPSVLGWDVMEQLCAWAGSVVVREPLWLVAAVVRRLRAGIEAMESGNLQLVVPEIGRQYASLGEALYAGADDDESAAAPPGARKLEPPSV